MAEYEVRAYVEAVVEQRFTITVPDDEDVSDWDDTGWEAAIWDLPTVYRSETIVSVDGSSYELAAPPKRES